MKWDRASGGHRGMSKHKWEKNASSSCIKEKVGGGGKKPRSSLELEAHFFKKVVEPDGRTPPSFYSSGAEHRGKRKRIFPPQSGPRRRRLFVGGEVRKGKPR